MHQRKNMVETISFLSGPSQSNEADQPDNFSCMTAGIYLYRSCRIGDFLLLSRTSVNIKPTMDKKEKNPLRVTANDLPSDFALRIELSFNCVGISCSSVLGGKKNTEDGNGT